MLTKDEAKRLKEIAAGLDGNFTGDELFRYSIPCGASAEFLSAAVSLVLGSGKADELKNWATILYSSLSDKGVYPDLDLTSQLRLFIAENKYPELTDLMFGCCNDDDYDSIFASRLSGLVISFDELAVQAAREGDTETAHKCARRIIESGIGESTLAKRAFRAYSEGDMELFNCLTDNGRAARIPDGRKKREFHYNEFVQEILETAVSSGKAGDVTNILNILGKYLGLSGKEYLKKILSREKTSLLADRIIMHICCDRTEKCTPEEYENLGEIARLMSRSGAKIEKTAHLFSRILQQNRKICTETAINALSPVLPDSVTISGLINADSGKLKELKRAYKGTVYYKLNRINIRFLEEKDFLFNTQKSVRDVMKNFGKYFTLCYDGDPLEFVRENPIPGILFEQDEGCLRLLMRDGIIGEEHADRITELCVEKRLYKILAAYNSLLYKFSGSGSKNQ